MPNEIRRRFNFQSGTSSGTVLVGATTLTSPNLVGFPAIGASEYATLVLDPAGAGNGPEVVYVTAHTASANNATIVRGREGTSAVQHSNAVVWIHSSTAADYPVVGDDNDQPSTGGLPYEGQMYVDTTNNEIEVYNGAAWVPFNYGAWKDYVPTLAGTSVSLGNGSIVARYTQIGKTVKGWITIIRGGSTNFGSSLFTISLPVTAYDPGNTVQTIGMVQALDVGTAWYEGAAYIDHNLDTGNDRMRLIISGSGVLNTWPFTWASGDYLLINFSYEAA